MLSDFFQKYNTTMTAKFIDTINMSVMVFLIGATGYSIIEYIFRGYTHWSMALTGGACLLAFYYYAKANRQTATMIKATVGACIFTVFEFFVGLVVNVWFGWHVWDYSAQPGNLIGQICPMFSFIWFLICLTILLVYENLHLIYSAFHHGV